MIIGLDMGSSAVKVAGLEGGALKVARYEPNDGRRASEIVSHALADSGVPVSAVTGIMATGLGAERCDAEALGRPVRRLVELEAIGHGATYLAGEQRAVIANFGTGTSFILADNGLYTHLGGTGVGGGTVVGLGGRILGLTDPVEIDRLAAGGDVRRVDVTIGDLCTGGGTLMADLTASNLAKAAGNRCDADWAAGILNLVIQVVGTMSVLCCGGHGLDTVIVTGAVASLPSARAMFGRFAQIYGLHFLVPEDGRFATAIGAVLMGEEQQWS